MDPRLLRYYNEELRHLREMGAEFAQAFPKIASRLGVESLEVSDPYVERLLEGFAFLAGRVQLKIDAEFPRFTQRMLEMVYPQFLVPTPSMLIAQAWPDLSDPALAKGPCLPRGSALQAQAGQAGGTASVSFWRACKGSPSLRACSAALACDIGFSFFSAHRSRC